MRKIIAITHVSLDGVMQGPGGPEEDPSGGFTQGGWIMPYGDEVLGAELRSIMAGEFSLLLGRRTYEIFAPYWPQAGDHYIAKAFNRAVKYVVSSTLTTCTWETTHRLSGGDVPGKIRQLKASEGPDLHIWGSGQLLQSLAAADLVDEYRLWVYPVVLGQGKRLFTEGLPARTLTLMDSRRTTTGVLLNTYRRVD